MHIRKNAPMTRIDLQHKRFFVKMLALGESPAEVADMADGKFLISPDEEDVRRYLPQEGSADLSDDLRDYVDYIRERHYQDEQEAADIQETTDGYVQVAPISDLEGSARLCVEVDGEKIALFKWGNAVFALSNTCSHAGGPLSDGMVEDGQVECPLHGARFDLETGEAEEAPAAEGVTSYPVRLGAEYVEVRV